MRICFVKECPKWNLPYGESRVAVPGFFRQYLSVYDENIPMQTDVRTQMQDVLHFPRTASRGRTLFALSPLGLPILFHGKF